MGELFIMKVIGCKAALFVCVAATLLMTRGAWGQSDHTNPVYDRMAGWHRTLVTTNTLRPNSAVMTYHPEGMHNSEHRLLARIVPGVVDDSEVFYSTQAQDVEVRDLPGAVQATWRVAERSISSTVTPLMVGRGSDGIEGVALYEVSAGKGRPVVLRIGGGDVVNFHFNTPEPFFQDSVGVEGVEVERTAEGLGVFQGGRDSLHVGVRAVGGVLERKSDAGGAWFETRLNDGHGQVLVSFALDRARALALLDREPEKERAQVTQYYDDLLEANRLETPDETLNEAFAQALITMEYTWLEPFGWIEGIHHWVTLWHQQHVGAANWIGQQDRSRACLLETATRVLPSGAIPHLQPSGAARRDFGGADQFFFWEVEQYWRATGDTNARDQLLPVLRRTLEGAFGEYDPDNDGLLAWGLQIGNQEDFLATPYNGATPTSEGLKMIRVLAALERSAGNLEAAAKLEDRHRQIRAAYQTRLWHKDLGRPIYYRDPAGAVRPEGQYHSCISPVLGGQLDPLQSWTSLRHVRDRLSDAAGAVYVSNLFPDHLMDVWATWGMQAGVAQQPWAAWAFSELGLRQEAWRPLKAAAGWAMSDYHQGAWPEVAREARLGYFSPPAALYAQACIEALCGLKMDASHDTIEVAPCLPDQWPDVRLVLPGLRAEIEQRPGFLQYRLDTDKPLRRIFRPALPPCTIEKVTVDGKDRHYRLEGGVNGMRLVVETRERRESTLTVKYRPLRYNIEEPGSLAEGDWVELACSGIEVREVVDPSGLLAKVDMSAPDRIRVRLQDNLLDPWLRYGRVGQITFSRRTFFLSVRSNKGDTPFYVPVDITVLPRLEAAQKTFEPTADGGARLMLVFRNNTAEQLSENVTLDIPGTRRPLGAVVLEPRSETVLTCNLSDTQVNALPPGDVPAQLVLADGAVCDVTLDTAPLKRMPPAEELTIVPLPEALLDDDGNWVAWRRWFNGDPGLWRPPVSPLASLAEAPVVEVPGLPGLRFETIPRKLVPVGADPDGAPVRIPLDSSRVYKKVFLLTAAFINSADMHIPVARVDLLPVEPEGVGHGRHIGRPAIGRTFYSPGDLDWFYPVGTVLRLSSWHEPRVDRHGLLPLLPAGQDDWGAIARPPEFPQPQFWADSRAVSTPNAVFNVLEITLEKPVRLDALRITPLASDAVLGLVAGCALVDSPAEIAGKSNRSGGAP